jgi:hypothetical protein
VGHIPLDIPAATDTSDSSSDAWSARDYFRNAALLHEMMDLAAADTVASQAVVALSGRVDSASWAPGREGVPVSAERVVAVLANWMCATRALPAQRRAAALLVADRLLNRAWFVTSLSDSVAASARDELATMGAPPHYNDIGSGGFYYGGEWLHVAAALDPDGRAGQAAALLDVRYWCAASLVQYDSLIAQGEALATHALDPRIRREAHFIVADADRDIVALAAGETAEMETDASRYPARANVARQQAIAHYAAALATDSTSRMAVAALEDYHRLQAGKSPEGLRRFCRGE